MERETAAERAAQSNEAYKVAVALLTAIALIVGIFYLMLDNPPQVLPADPMGSTVKVEVFKPAVEAKGDKPAVERLLRGHGSATHIGNGYFITAAHVVSDATMEFEVRNQAGEKQAAEVLWANTRYDIALLRVAEASHYATTALSCSALTAVGEPLTFRGNPLAREFITTWGRVAGAMAPAPAWAEAVTVDGAIVMGMSGGGVFNAADELVGVIVGVNVASFGFGASLTNLGIVVPAATVCKLLADRV